MHRTLICTSLVARTSEALAALVSHPHPEADLVEARLDYLDQIDLERILAVRPKPVIATVRLRQDRGEWSGGEELRLELLRRASSLGAEYIDVEWDRLEQFEYSGGAQLIGSYHNFEETPDALAEVVESLESSQAAIVKVATFCRDLSDHVKLIDVLRTASKPTIAVSMGPHGHLTRMLGPKYGAFLVFASLAEGAQAAPGQVPVEDLVHRFRFRSIGSSTRVVAVPSTDSMSWKTASRWNALFADQFEDAVAVPVPVLTQEDFDAAKSSVPFQSTLDAEGRPVD